MLAKIIQPVGSVDYRDARQLRDRSSQESGFRTVRVNEIVLSLPHDLPQDARRVQIGQADGALHGNIVNAHAQLANFVDEGGIAKMLLTNNGAGNFHVPLRGLMLQQIGDVAAHTGRGGFDNVEDPCSGWVAHADWSRCSSGVGLLIQLHDLSCQRVLIILPFH